MVFSCNLGIEKTKITNARHLISAGRSREKLPGRYNKNRHASQAKTTDRLRSIYIKHSKLVENYQPWTLFHYTVMDSLSVADSKSTTYERKSGKKRYMYQI